MTGLSVGALAWRREVLADARVGGSNVMPVMLKVLLGQVCRPGAAPANSSAPHVWRIAGSRGAAHSPYVAHVCLLGHIALTQQVEAPAANNRVSATCQPTRSRNAIRHEVARRDTH